MAFLPIELWVDHPGVSHNFWHRYISRDKLVELLSALPDGSVISVTPVGNLGVFAGLDQKGYDHAVQLGTVEIGDEEYDDYETTR